ncbi:MAG: 3-phosphoshikimate 1-carboxyvinyltransferase [Gammaproteobacteria bacterium]
MNLVAMPTTKIHGEVTCPADKSITQRVLLLGALQNKDLKITNPLLGADPISTANALRALGAQIDITDEVLFREHKEGLASSPNPLDLGNSGTGLRLLIGMVVGLRLNATFIGDASLSTRPMQRIIDPLSDFGAFFEHSGFMLPIKTFANILHPSFSYTLPIASAQVKSSILLAGLAAGSEVIIHESIQTRNHTELMFKDFGVNLEVHQSSQGNDIFLPKHQNLYKTTYDVAGDISSAAFLIAAALLAKDSYLIIRNVGLNPSRIGFLEVIQAMNANIKIIDKIEKNGELRGSIIVESSELSSIDLGGSIIPNIIDEIPIICILAAFAEGRSIIKDAAELRKKESDRIKAVVNGLEKIGTKVVETEDGLTITGKSYSSEEPALIDSFKDHRIAMSFLISAIGIGKQVLVKDAENIATSFPQFIDLVGKIGMTIHEA